MVIYEPKKIKNDKQNLQDCSQMLRFIHKTDEDVSMKKILNPKGKCKL